MELVLFFEDLQHTEKGIHTLHFLFTDQSLTVDSTSSITVTTVDQNQGFELMYLEFNLDGASSVIVEINYVAVESITYVVRNKSICI